VIEWAETLLYILYGQDDFSLREALEEIQGGLGDPELLGVNTTTLEGKQLSLSELRNACDAAPFLSPQRLVIVRGLLERFERGRRAGRRSRPTRPGPGEQWPAFSTYIKAIPPSTVLILVDGILRSANPLLRELSSVARVKSFPLLRGPGLRDWIRRQVERYEGSISPQAVNSLADLVGGNLWMMASEIEKLLLYASGRRIEESDLPLVVSYAREANVFAMVDALLQSQPAAGRLLHQLLEEGAAPAYLLFMIVRQLRLLVLSKELRHQRVSPAEAQDRLGLTSEYALQKTLAQAESYSMERLKEAYRILLETDLAIKTGRWKDELALDLLVAELCRGRA
jgi:DNA polymerase-3 subunit delta